MRFFVEKELIIKVSFSGKVYAHCMSGVSRSAAIVISFLLLKRNMQIMEAVKSVRDKRKILPNDGFLKELVDLNSRLYGPQK